MREPTKEFYNLLQDIYMIFNQKLFDSSLPNCLISIQRQHDVMGYFSANRFINEDSSKTHEIALNPNYFSKRKLIEIFQTLVHEMCHLWQYEQGKPSRSGYHNKEWADKMETIGLMPSDTGHVGGRRTGQKMSDYPKEGGEFLKVSKELIQNKIFIKWFDRYAIDIEEIKEELESGEHLEENLLTMNISSIIFNLDELVDNSDIRLAAKKKTKTKYLCPSCHTALWGKPNINIMCMDCDVRFESVS